MSNELHNLPHIELEKCPSLYSIQRLFNSNNSKYYGYQLEDQRHGTGILIAPFCFYQGEFKTDRAFGMGYLKDMKRQLFYQGQMADGLREGLGLLENPLFEYFGQFKKDKFNGPGVFKLSESVEIQGYFQNGKIEGFAVIADFENEEVIKSYFHNGQRDLYCIHKANRIEYRGQYNKGGKNGFGQLIQPEKVYTGFWEDDHRSGFGKLEIGSKATFFGEFWQNMRMGVGIENDSKSEFSFTGTYNSGHRNGFGSMVTPDYTFTGGWNSNKRSGIGLIECVGDIKYFGYWRADKRTGLGIYYNKKTVIRAEWTRDRLNGRVHTTVAGSQSTFQLYSKGQLIEEIKESPEDFLALFKPLNIDRFLIYTKRKIAEIEKLIDQGKRSIEKEMGKAKTTIDIDDKRLQLDILGLKSKYSKLEERLRSNVHALRGILAVKGVKLNNLTERSENGLSTRDLEEIHLQYNTGGTLIVREDGSVQNFTIDLSKSVNVSDSMNLKGENSQISMKNEGSPFSIKYQRKKLNSSKEDLPEKKSIVRMKKGKSKKGKKSKTPKESLSPKLTPKPSVKQTTPVVKPKPVKPVKKVEEPKKAAAVAPPTPTPTPTPPPAPAPVEQLIADTIPKPAVEDPVPATPVDTKEDTPAQEPEVKKEEEAPPAPSNVVAGIIGDSQVNIIIILQGEKKEEEEKKADEAVPPPPPPVCFKHNNLEN